MAGQLPAYTWKQGGFSVDLQLESSTGSSESARGRPVGQPSPTVGMSNCRMIGDSTATNGRDLQMTPADVDTPFPSTSKGGIE